MITEDQSPTNVEEDSGEQERIVQLGLDLDALNTMAESMPEEIRRANTSTCRRRGSVAYRPHGIAFGSLGAQAEAYSSPATEDRPDFSPLRLISYTADGFGVTP